MAPVSTIVSLRRAGGDGGERNVDGHRNGPQLRAGQHHHRRHAVPGGKPGEMRQIFGVAGKSEAGVVENFLGDRPGHQRGGPSGHRVLDAAVDRFDDACRIAALRLARVVGKRVR